MSVEELSAQVESLTVEVQTRDATIASLVGDVQARDASIAGLVEAVQNYERSTEALKAEIAALTAQVDELTKKTTEQDSVIASYRDAVLDQIRRLLK